MPATKANLDAARRAADDEFYTRPKDVEAEFAHYAGLFEGKRVLCNADDPARSAFYAHFRDRYAELGLAGLTATGLGAMSSNRGRPVGATFDGFTESQLDLRTGSFASPECLAIAQRHDVIVSNPPFSMIRGYLKVLLELGCEFSFLGPLNAVGYKDFWRPMRQGIMRMGASGRASMFDRPDGNATQLANVVWYTNMPHTKTHPPRKLTARYAGNEAHYPRYANHDAINVDKAAEIPGDYAGPIGVPVSFIPTMNHDQFEIVGLGVCPWIRDEDGNRVDVFKRVIVQRRDLERPAPEGRLI